MRVSWHGGPLSCCVVVDDFFCVFYCQVGFDWLAVRLRYVQGMVIFCNLLLALSAVLTALTLVLRHIRGRTWLMVDESGLFDCRNVEWESRILHHCLRFGL